MSSETYLTDLDVAAKFKISRATVWRWMRGGKLPRPYRLGPNCVRFAKSEIEAVEAQLERA